MLTLKLKYKCLDQNYYDILNEYMSQYSICLHYLYNRLSDNKGIILEKDLRTSIKSINGIDLLDSWFRQSCVKESIALYKAFQFKYKEHEESREKNLKDIDFKHKIGKLSDHRYSYKKNLILKKLSLIFGGKTTINVDKKERFLKNSLNRID